MRSIPPKTSEHAEQSAVCDWWALAHKRYGLPEFALYAVPNGNLRTFSVGAKLKAEGVRRGILDLHLDVPRGSFHALHIEMKIWPNKPSPEQEAVMRYLVDAGYRVLVCWSAEQAVEAIKQYLQSR